MSKTVNIESKLSIELGSPARGQKVITGEGTPSEYTNQTKPSINIAKKNGICTRVKLHQFDGPWDADQIQLLIDLLEEAKNNAEDD